MLCALFYMMGKEYFYIGTERGLFIYKGGSLNQIMIDPNMLSAANSIGGLNLGEDGILWMATENGLLFSATFR